MGSMELAVMRLEQENARLRGAMRIMLASPGNVTGRAIAEHLLDPAIREIPEYRKICPSCGGTFIGLSCYKNACQVAECRDFHP